MCQMLDFVPVEARILVWDQHLLNVATDRTRNVVSQPKLNMAQLCSNFPFPVFQFPVVSQPKLNVPVAILTRVSSSFQDFVLLKQLRISSTRVYLLLSCVPIYRSQCSNRLSPVFQSPVPSVPISHFPCSNSLL